MLRSCVRSVGAATLRAPRHPLNRPAASSWHLAKLRCFSQVDDRLVSDSEASTSEPDIEDTSSFDFQPSRPKTVADSYLKYLPKGVSPDEVDWSLLDPSLAPSTSDTTITKKQPRIRTNSQPAAVPQTTDATFTTQLVQWYPGHIAKAERQLKEQLSKVDVVLEVLDARIPASTTHPQLTKWIGSKPRLLLLNRIDMISRSDLQQWEEFLRKQRGQVFCTNGQQGTGVNAVKKALLKVGETVNEKRSKRGLMPRAVRACVVGFPNIGKSALINRLLGRRVVDSAPLPGVTRALRWVRLGGEVDLLDAPGIIPASFGDQLAAQRLAMCNDIGQAAYEDALIAAALIIRIKSLPCAQRVATRMAQRYKLDPRRSATAEDYVQAVADRMFLGDRDRAGLRLLQDFRGGALGEFSLELPGDWQH